MDSSAIFGFAGVLVGAGSTYVMQRGSEKRQDKAETRIGIRLSHLDLIELRTMLSGSLDRGEIWEAGAVATPRWDEYDAAFAKTLPLEDWMTVEHAIYFARSLETEARRTEVAGTTMQLTTGQRELINKTINDLDEATTIIFDLLYKTQTRRVRAQAWVKERREKKKKVEEEKK